MTPDDARLILYRLDRQDEKLDSIEKHVKETNGRVKVLELWRAGIVGTAAVVRWFPALTGSVVSGVLVYVLTH